MAALLDVVAQWSEEKPVSGTIPPTEAIELLRTYETRMEKLRVEAEIVSRAKEALALPSTRNDALTAALEEVNDFKSVLGCADWDVVRHKRASGHFMDQSSSHEKLRQALDGLVKTTKDMPSRNATICCL